jgi:hypothetical protein
MTMTVPSKLLGVTSHEELALLGIADAFDLLAAAVDDRGSDFVVRSNSGPDISDYANLYAFDGEPQCIVGYALSLAHVRVQDLESMCDQPVRDLYRDGRLPIPITLGALIVLDAAQRSEGRGRRWGDVLDDATAAVARFLDLASVVPEVAHSLDQCGTRCPIRFNTSPVSARSHDPVTRPGSCLRRSAAIGRTVLPITQPPIAAESLLRPRSHP